MPFVRVSNQNKVQRRRGRKWKREVYIPTSFGTHRCHSLCEKRPTVCRNRAEPNVLASMVKIR